MKSSEHFMLRCFELAQSGLGNVAPNPLVGALLVHNGKIIGEGFHQEIGKAHAEINAINDAEKKYPQLISESELYVNLEPCSHFGKTPPCTDFIITKGLKKVFISNTDSNPLVAGKGIKKLRSAGIEVIENLLSIEGRNLNKRFFSFHEKKRPFIILKWAQTADGFIAPESKNKIQITGELSQQQVHKWRSEEQSILVGKNTVLSDNPQLNVRLWRGKNPIRLIIDSKLSIPKNLKIFNNETPTIIFNSIKTAEQKNITWVKLDFTSSILKQLLSYLYSKNIQSILVEGGSLTLQKFINENLWDEAKIFTSTKKLIQGINAPIIFREDLKSELLSIADDNLKIIYNYH